MSTTERVLIAWGLVFTVPKLLIVPAVHVLRRALADTERQEELDRLWLATQGSEPDGGPGPGWRKRRRRSPKPPRPGNGRVHARRRRGAGGRQRHHAVARAVVRRP